MQIPSESISFNEDDFIVVHGERHGAGGIVPGASYHCYFSFRSPKSYSKEDRMRSLRLLFERMIERVEDAHNNIF